MERTFIRILLDPVATLSGDPVLAAILNIERSGDDASRQILEASPQERHRARLGCFDPEPPGMETPLGSGATLKRAIPKAGRNDPCPAQRQEVQSSVATARSARATNTKSGE